MAMVFAGSSWSWYYHLISSFVPDVYSYHETILRNDAPCAFRMQKRSPSLSCYNAWSISMHYLLSTVRKIGATEQQTPGHGIELAVSQ